MAVYRITKGRTDATGHYSGQGWTLQAPGEFAAKYRSLADAKKAAFVAYGVAKWVRSTPPSGVRGRAVTTYTAVG